MVIMREPANRIPYNGGYYGPAGGHRYRVRDGDNWFSVAKRDGYADPWELIKYNFRTSDPAEVNWYLRHFVGCDVCKDGKNYSLSDSAKPGYIYTKTNIYEKEYVPPDDELSRKAVLATLNHPRIQGVRFIMYGYYITPSLFQKVSQCVGNGRIRVRHDSSLSDGARYYASDIGEHQGDTLKIGFTYANSDEKKALIVHESTHAGLDYLSASGLHVRQSEALAYLAQCTFYELITGGASRLSDNAGDGIIFDTATPIAEKIAAAQHSFNTYTVPLSDERAMTSAIASSSTYKKKHFHCSYDGIRDPYDLEG